MKKAIKIAASTAVAASAFVAVAPTQQAENRRSTVKTCRSTSNHW